MQWTVEQILQATQGRLIYGDPRQRFEGVGIDSRRMPNDHLFVAICGENHDGHTFIEQVVEQGVRGLVIQEDTPVPLNHDHFRDRGAACVSVPHTTAALGALAAFQREKFRIPVVAITGSNGKTTTRQMTALVMARRYTTLSTQGNLNNEIGLPLTLFNLSPQHQAAVLELGMNHHGEISRLAAICRPTIGVITNVAPAHLEFLGSLEGVARAKGELLTHIDAQGTVVLNGDDPHVAALAARAHGSVCFFGTTAKADVRAEAVRQTARGVAFDLVLSDTRVALQLQTPGLFMVSNALAAAAAGYVAGLQVSEIKAGLEAFTEVKGRINVSTLPNGVQLIDDTYNANPASMAAAFQTLSALRGSAAGFIVLGDMLELGAHAAALHRQVGQMAARSGVQRLYLFGPHAQDAAEGARSGDLAPEAIFVGTKEDIGADIIRHLQTGDWVLVKGSRGMAMETVVEAIRAWAGNQVPESSPESSLAP